MQAVFIPKIPHQGDFTQTMTIELPIPDKRRIATLFDARLREYHQDLTLEGLTSQQYDVLRGRIKELQSLSLELALSDTES